MSPPVLADADLLPPRYAMAALGMPRTSWQALDRRGQLGAGFYGSVAAGGRRLFTRRGFLALALVRAMSERKIEVAELSPDACIRWADLWLRARGAEKPIRELWVRYYGRPGDPDATISLLPNADVLRNGPPAPGAQVTIVFDLDQIFGRAERTLRELLASPGDPVEVFDLPDAG